MSSDGASTVWQLKKEARRRMEAEKLRARREKYAARAGGAVRGRPPSPTEMLRPVATPPEPKRARTESPEPERSNRVMEVAISSPPQIAQEPPPPTLDDRLGNLCRRYHAQPYNFKNIWTDNRVNVVIVQLADTYGAQAALFKWIEALTPGRVAKAYDLTVMRLNLSKFLANVWIAQDDKTRRGIVPVIVGATDELLGWLCDIVGMLPPRERAKTYQRVVLVTGDAYGDGANLTKLRRLEPVRVCKVGALSEECLRRCLSLVLENLNKASAAHNRGNGSQRTILKLSEAQTRAVITQSAGDPRWFVHALGYRVLSGGKMNLRALATDDTGMNDVQIGTRLMLGSLWSHLAAIEIEAPCFGALQEAVEAQRGMVLEVVGRGVSHPGKALVRANIVAPGCCRSQVMKVLNPLPVSASIKPLLGGEHVTATVETLIEVNYAHAVEIRVKESRRKDGRADVLKSMAAVADDLAVCSELAAPYAHRDRLAGYTTEIRALTVPARCGAYSFEGYTADQLKQLEVCSRKVAGRFYEHLGGIKRGNGRQRLMREFLSKQAAGTPPVEVAMESQIRGFWNQHIPVVELASHHYARDAGLYAAVAFHVNPPGPGDLEPIASWAEHQDAAPRTLCARSLAEWFSKRCRYGHFTTSVAWTLAWSSLAEEVAGVKRPARLLAAIGSMLRAAMDRAPVVREIEGGRRMPKNWLRGRFPPALGGDAELRPHPGLVAEVVRVWGMAQSVLAL